jgi:hypothetical protein
MLHNRRKVERWNKTPEAAIIDFEKLATIPISSSASLERIEKIPISKHLTCL